MAVDDHYVYLTDLGNRDVYPDNTPGQFENRLNPPLNLDPNKDAYIPRLSTASPKRIFQPA